MTTYEAALFLHLIGLAGMFAGIGIEHGTLHFARKADRVETVRSLLSLGALGGKSIPLFSLLILISGVYMVEDVWKWDIAWIQVALVAFIVLFAMGPLINARHAAAMGMEAGRAPDGPVPPSLREKLDDPVLHTSEVTMTTATLGIIYLMVVKPETAVAILSMLIAVAIGLLLSVQAWFRRHGASGAGQRSVRD